MTSVPDPSADWCGSEHCITCGDDGVPMTVIAVDDGRGLALCEDEDGGRASIEVGLVEPVMPQDRLLVHAGVALVALTAESGR